MKANDLFMEFVTPERVCGLCGQGGVIDTRGKLTTPAGVTTGILAWCICPNGRSLKKQLGPKVIWKESHDCSKE